jgi:hypothetical protein
LPPHCSLRVFDVEGDDVKAAFDGGIGQKRQPHALHAARVQTGGIPMLAAIDGVVRGTLPHGFRVRHGQKSGDIDPRCEPCHCFTVSDASRNEQLAVREENREKYEKRENECPYSSFRVFSRLSRFSSTERSLAIALYRPLTFSQRPSPCLIVLAPPFWGPSCPCRLRRHGHPPSLRLGGGCAPLRGAQPNGKTASAVFSI